MASELKKQVVKGSIWSLLERFSSQIIVFGVSMVLARILTPADYGTVALLSLFIVFASVLIDGGLGLALIQKKDVSELDFNSVFYCSLTLSGLLYVALFFLSPKIADFYGVPILIDVLRVQAITLLFASINTIQNAEIARTLQFNLSFKVSIISSVTSAVVGICMALSGYGVWALVWSQVISSIVATISRSFIVRWKPKLMFSFASLKPLFGYGWKMVLVNLIDTFYKNFYGLLIGKIYTKEDLAFVNKGQNQPLLLMGSIEGTLSRVALPTMSKLQNEKERMVSTMRKMIVCSTFFVFPLMTILGCTAYGQVKLMYGDQWLPCVPYIQLACFQMSLYPLHNMNLQAIAACGRTDLSLTIEIIKKSVSILIVIIAIRYSVWVLMASMAFIIGPFSVLVNSWPNRKLFGYSIEQQVRDILPTTGICIVIGIIMFVISLLNMHYIFVLVFQCISGVFFYMILSVYFRTKGIREILNIGGRDFISKCPFFLRSYLLKTYNYLEID